MYIHVCCIHHLLSGSILATASPARILYSRGFPITELSAGLGWTKRSSKQMTGWWLQPL